ncbi:hypothetical protein [Chryseobacterium sp. EO14]|uniref:hypothetical protein n=1 Tax=Chryseobacterium sp. EO14 TaxID=2950551 RepID=UPI00210AEEC9|nr:hypothetical protein [Chryseobacterium sp. EO14]MCQ4140309.1 hypothetical protein [Chryseobacterium sp. EO14]
MKITREEITVEILELLYDFQYVLEHQKSDIYFNDPTKLLLSKQIRFRRICSVFAYLNIQIKDLKHFYDLEFINEFKDYEFAEEIAEMIESSIDGFYKIEDIKIENLKEILKSIIYFRKAYLNLVRGFFGGVRLMGIPSIEERVSEKIMFENIHDINLIVERINKTITYLLFPNTENFETDILINQYNFPTEDYRAIWEKEQEDYYENGF